MPHTSRRHRNHVSNNPLRAAHGKRLQITDDDGWVHVVNSSTAASSPRAAKEQQQQRIYPPVAITATTTDGAADVSEQTSRLQDEGGFPVILPAEAPPRLTLSSLRRKFDADLAAWQTSTTWTTLSTSLLRILDRLPASSVINRLVCIGLGSPSGLRDGWVDRRDVASFQLAAFVSLVETVRQRQQRQERKISQTGNAESAGLEIIAQDPVFNSLDTQLLVSLGITVVPTPQGFSRVSEQTLLFAPGAEKRHLELVLPARPVMLFGGPLEEQGRFHSQNQDKDRTESVIDRFLTTTQSVGLAEFPPRPEAFWRMSVYWRE